MTRYLKTSTDKNNEFEYVINRAMKKVKSKNSEVLYALIFKKKQIYCYKNIL
jgi:hypothetical protein